ncbi:hypothetical protein [Streptomyces cellulosae]|uniref:hypothetical protein n=1 Tax=Streptomyces cellulosae TaxID=1968 RepID=UPI00131BAA85|nr:hypothetical protein [Streptomyces cellulosae]
MPPDHVTGRFVRDVCAGVGRGSRAGTCARAGLFAVLGTVLATFGHHAVAEGTVPWRLMAVLAGAQFAAVWPLARRRYVSRATVGFTPAVQGVLHVVLSWADGDTSMAPRPRATHAGHLPVAFGDGHAWHHAGAAMTTVHTVAALVTAWLLHRADVRMTAARATLRTLARAAVAGLARVRPPLLVADPAGALPTLPDGRGTGAFAVAARGREDLLEHVMARRGPPRGERLPSRHRPRFPPGRILPFPQGVPPCPSPPTCWSMAVAVSPSSRLPR